MTALTLWLAVLGGGVVFAAAGAVALPMLAPRGGVTTWTWVRAGLLLVATLVVGVAVGALSSWDTLRRVDETAQVAIAEVDNDLLERGMLAVTGIGEIAATGFLAVLVGLALGYHQRSLRLLVAPVLAYIVSLPIQRYVDGVDGRPRPDPELAIGPVGGYPSGGTGRVIVVVGVIVIVLAQVWRSQREIAVLGAVWGLLSWLELASRSVLGRHWPLDLAGAVIMSALLLAAIAPFLRLGKPVPRGPAEKMPADSARKGVSVA